MSKSNLIFFLILSCSIISISCVTEKIIYSVSSSDRISSIHQLSNGWILGGIGLSDRKSKDSEATMVLSKDNGVTWKEVWVSAATDKKTYMIQSNGKYVIAVRGDRGQPQVLRSTNYGETWSVALSSTAIKNLCGSTGSLYSVIYHKYENKFYVFPSGAVIESSDNGATWKKSALKMPGCSRNAYYDFDRDDMYVPDYYTNSPGLYIYRKGTKAMAKVLNGTRISAVGFFGKGIVVASGFTTISGKDFLIVKAQRTNNTLKMILNSSAGGIINEGDIITISVPKKNQFSDYGNTNTKVLKVVSNVVTVAQKGNDTSLITMETSSRIYSGKGKNYIFLSTDSGSTWKKVNTFTGCNHEGYIEFAREFAILPNGIGYLSIAGYEEEYNWQGLGEILKTSDYGKTWAKSNDIKGLSGKRLNAIYRCTKLKDNRLMCGAQYGRIIMTLE